MTPMIRAVDVSEHQGQIHVRAMLDVLATQPGRHGLIIRSNHTTTTDARLGELVWNVAAAGWPREDVGFYNFLNPKRCPDPAQAAEIWLQTIVHYWGGLDTFLMLDIESYVNESPNKGQRWSPAQYAAWLRGFVARLRASAPDTPLIGYSNRAYYDSGVGDRGFAGSLDWIVARYLAYFVGGHVAYPVPLPPGWEDFAFSFGKFPEPPTGANGWQGWQFSAGFNEQGPRYGCQSSSLDLNLIRPDAWLRWTRTQPKQTDPESPVLPVRPEPAPIPRRRSDMANLITNADPRDMGAGTPPGGWAPGFVKWAVEYNEQAGRYQKVHLAPSDYAALIGTPENSLSNTDLDAIPDYEAVPAGWAASGFVGRVESVPGEINLRAT